ncbi:universal stress protein [Rhodococcus oxybenzonivorans]|nr:universal stress protein [Rhodococcus oxybenzonivorans]
MNRDGPVPCVVVPLDGSAQARRALDPAMRVAQVLGCSIELVTVYDPVRGRWARDLDDIADRMPFEQVEVAVVGSGWPGEVLADVAGDHPGTLICMATQDHDQLQRLALGSVSTHLMRATDGPILFVGPGYTPQQDLPRYRDLVVCIDNSSRADTAVRLAAVWAARLGLGITLVHVAADLAGQLEMESELAAYVDRLTDGGAAATATVLISDSPAHAVAELLGSRPDALALTVSQGRGSLTRLLLGSVTSELLARSPAPVLVA